MSPLLPTLGLIELIIIASLACLSCGIPLIVLMALWTSLISKTSPESHNS